MTDNVPAVPERDNLPAVTPPPDLDSWAHIMGAIVRLSEHIADTEFVPKGLRGNAPAAAAAMLYGREVGLPPMTALNSTHVIDGSPSLSAETMRAMVLAAGHEIEPVESTGAVCIYRGRRRGSDRWHTVTWTIDMARAAGLAGNPRKDNWNKYPRRMLQARASSELCEILFPDVIAGFRTYEVVADDVDEDGTPTPAPSTGTRVARKRAARALGSALTRQAEAMNAAAGETPPAPVAEYQGPPLPGEPGYAGDDTPPPHRQEDPDGREQGEAAQPSGPSAEPAPGGESADDPGGSPKSADAAGEETPVAGRPTSPADLTAKDLQPISKGQHRMLMAQLSRLGIDMSDEGRADRLSVVSDLVGRGISSTNDLRAHEARRLSDTLSMLRNPEALAELVDAVNESRRP